MSFADELIKAQRIVNAFLSYAGEDFYGKSYDARGPVDVQGTVVTFGAFNRALCNTDATLETPSADIELIDINNVWRMRGAPPSDALLYQFVQLWLRIRDDAGDIHDHALASGQIMPGGTSFPPNRRVSLGIELNGGQFLGDNIPRRLVTSRDFPRAAPEEIGKAVPIVFGRFVNASVASDVAAEAQGDCASLDDIAMQESFANGASVAFNQSGANWETPPLGTETTDPLYPFVMVTEGVEVETNGGPGIGQNALVELPSYFGAVVFHQMGDVYYDANYPNLLAAHSGNVTFQMLHSRSYLGFTEYIYQPIITILGYNVYDYPVTAALYESDGGMYLEYEIQTASGTLTDVVYLGTVDEYEAGGWYTYSLCWQCGTWNGSSIASDGWIRLQRDGVDLFSHSNISLTVSWTEDEFHNDIVGVAFGWYGLAGKLTGIEVSTGDVAPAGAETCAGSPGISQQLTGGALRALLVDTGTIPLVSSSDYVDPAFTEEATLAAPANPATNSVTGGTITGSVYVRVLARVGDVYGTLTSLVSLTDANPHSARVTWEGVAGADDYVVWMSTSSVFHPITNSDASARVKTTTALEVTFTTPEDGDSWVPTLTEETTPSTTPQGFRFMLAGHTLKEVLQVYVKKHVPTVTDTEAFNVLQAGVAVGAGTLSIAYGGESVQFSEGSEMLITGDSEPYSVLSTLEGTVKFTPGARLAFAAGTTVYRSSRVEQQVLQVEGTDYEQEVVEINGNRYHTLVFYERVQDPESCAYYEVTANVHGGDLNADGTGMLIENGVSILQHMLKNWIFNNYRSSEGPWAPSGNKWFEDIPYAPGLVHDYTFGETNFVTSGRISGNYLGAGALTQQIPAAQLIHDLCTSFDLDLYYDVSVAKWAVRTFDPGRVVRASLPTFTPDAHVLKDSFNTSFDVGSHANVIPYFGGPMTGTRADNIPGGEGGYIISGEVSDPESIARFGQIIAEPLALPWVRDPLTAYDVVYRRLLRTKNPQVVATFKCPLSVLLSGWQPEVFAALLPYRDILASYIKVTHPDGLGDTADGWLARVVRVLRADVDLDEMTVELVVHDIDGLVT